jgi:hypothetical protein
MVSTLPKKKADKIEQSEALTFESVAKKVAYCL